MVTFWCNLVKTKFTKKQKENLEAVQSKIVSEFVRMSERVVDQSLSWLIMHVGGENQNAPKPPCPLVFGTHAPQHSKLAFRKTCCWRAPNLKSSKTCQPEHQFFFERPVLKVCFQVDLTRTCTIRTSSPGTEILHSSKRKLLPHIFLASVSSQSQSVQGTSLNATT